MWTGDSRGHLAKSLVTLLGQVDAMSPQRDRDSDGSIGNEEHQARASDHNRDAKGNVHAIDITHDPASGVDTYKMADYLIEKRDPRLKYVISNSRIAGDEDYAKRNGAKAWTWAKYGGKGKNPHDHHMHISVDTATGDDTRPWDIKLFPRTTAPAAPAEPKRPVLALGSTGEAVKELQGMLLLPAMTGTLDQPTEDAVRKYQAAHDLGVDGKVGFYTWRALVADPPKPGGPTPPAPKVATGQPFNMSAVIMLAGTSALSRVTWTGRGHAPIGYTKGMAAAFATVYADLRAGDAIAKFMARQNSNDDDHDVISWYNSNFRALGMANDVPGADVLRHLFVLLTGLGMRESSGQYNEGRDTSASNTTSDTAEAGLFQTSWDAHTASPFLGDLFHRYDTPADDGLLVVFKEGVKVRNVMVAGSGTGKRFQELSKIKPLFAVEFAAIGVRSIRKHWGPLVRKEAELRTEADELFRAVQKIVDESSAVA